MRNEIREISSILIRSFNLNIKVMFLVFKIRKIYARRMLLRRINNIHGHLASYDVIIV